MTDEHARRAQADAYRIKRASAETLHEIEVNAIAGGWHSLIKPMIEKRREDLEGRQ